MKVVQRHLQIIEDLRTFSLSLWTSPQWIIPRHTSWKLETDDEMLRRTIHQQLSTHQQLWIGRLFQRLNLWRPSGWTVVGSPEIYWEICLLDIKIGFKKCQKTCEWISQKNMESPTTSWPLYVPWKRKRLSGIWIPWMVREFQWTNYWPIIK